MTSKRPLRPRRSVVLVLSAVALVLCSPHRGSTAVGLWTSVNGAALGIAIDPVDSDTLYAGGGEAGVFMSRDGGVTWRASSVGFSSSALKGGSQAFAIDPNTPTTIYAGIFGAGVLESTNAGGSWTLMNTGLTSKGVLALAMDPKTPTTLYAGTQYGGVFKTTNGGGSWVTINNGAMPPFAYVDTLAIDPDSPGTLYAGTIGSGAFKTLDGGATWSASNTVPANSDVWVVAIAPSDPSVVYAVTNVGMFRSQNGGTAWTRIMPSGLPASTYIDDVVVHPTNPNVVYTSFERDGLYRSIDGGATWLLVNHEVWGSMTIDQRAPDTMYVSNGHVNKSTDGGVHFGLVKPALAEGDITAIVLDPTTPDTIYAGTSNSGVFKTTDEGASWRSVNSGLTNLGIGTLAVAETQPPKLYIGTYGGSGAGVFRSVDGGMNWIPINAGMTVKNINSIVVDPKTPTNVYAATYSNFVFRSANGGESWTASNAGHEIDRLAIDPQVPTTLYGAAGFGGVLKSIDGGVSWAPANDGMPELVDVLSIAVHPSSSDVVYAGTWVDGIYVSVDGAKTWSPVSTDYGGTGIHVLAVDPISPNTVYAAKWGYGILRSQNAGVTWGSWSDGLPNPHIQALAASAIRPGALYAGTFLVGSFPRGVFSVDEHSPGPTPIATETPRKTASTPSQPTPTPTPEASPEGIATSVPPNGCCTTAGPGGATPEDPVETTVCLPAGGACAIIEARAGGTAPTGYSLVGQAITISAPQATATDPLVLVFTIDGSQLPPGQALIAVQILRNGTVVRTCAGGSGQAVPDPCVAKRRLVGGDLELTVLKSAASVWNPVVSSLDALLCYGAKVTKGAVPFTPVLGPRLVDAAATLRSGPFFAKAPKTFDLAKAGTFCAPVGLDGGAIVRPAVGFQEYLLKLPKVCSDDDRRCANAAECNPGATCGSQASKVCADDGSACTKSEPCTGPAKCIAHKKFLATADVATTSVLGQMVLHVGKPSGALIPTARTTTGPLPAGTSVDRYKCYDVKPANDVCVGAPARTCSGDDGCGDDGPCFRGLPAGRTVRLQGDLTPTPKTFVVKKPTALCVPANAGTVALEVPATVLQCFAVKGAAGEPKHVAAALSLQSDLGQLARTTAKEAELCLPAEAIVKGLP